MPQFSHAVRTADDRRRAAYAPNNKFKASWGSTRNEPAAYKADYGLGSVRYCDNGYHGDDAPSLTFSELVFFPQWLDF